MPQQAELHGNAKAISIAMPGQDELQLLRGERVVPDQRRPVGRNVEEPMPLVVGQQIVPRHGESRQRAIGSDQPSAGSESSGNGPPLSERDGNKTVRRRIRNLHGNGATNRHLQTPAFSLHSGQIDYPPLLSAARCLHFRAVARHRAVFLFCPAKGALAVKP
ncbi:hypothetical protein QFZ27_001725 [Inquilinus ginsengisoli]